MSNVEQPAEKSHLAPLHGSAMIQKLHSRVFISPGSMLVEEGPTGPDQDFWAPGMPLQKLDALLQITAAVGGCLSSRCICEQQHESCVIEMLSFLSLKSGVCQGVLYVV